MGRATFKGNETKSKMKQPSDMVSIWDIFVIIFFVSDSMFVSDPDPCIDLFLMKFLIFKWYWGELADQRI